MNNKNSKNSKLKEVLDKIPKRGVSKDFQNKQLKIIVKDALNGVRPGMCKYKFPQTYNVVYSVYDRLRKLGYDVVD